MQQEKIPLMGIGSPVLLKDGADFEVICGDAVKDKDVVGEVIDCVIYPRMDGLSDSLVIVQMPDQTEFVTSEHHLRRADV